MPHPTPDQIADIVLGKQRVYDIDVDSRIRELANRVTARAFFELLGRLDDNSPTFGSEVFETLGGALSELSGVIGFDTGDIRHGDPSDAEEEIAKPKEYYLKLVFCDEQAAYYQFPIFPDLAADYVLGATRKRTGAVQHLHLTLSGPEALQTFIALCRSNPHFVRIEESSVDEFERALSNAI